MPQLREIESYIHDETLKDLIIANWLMVAGVIRYSEEVTHMAISDPDDKGIRKLTVRFEPDIQVT